MLEKIEEIDFDFHEGIYNELFWQQNMIFEKVNGHMHQFDTWLSDDRFIKFLSSFHFTNETVLYNPFL